MLSTYFLKQYICLPICHEVGAPNAGLDQGSLTKFRDEQESD